MFKSQAGRARIDRRRAMGAFGGVAAAAALLGGLRRGPAARAGHDDPAIIGTWIGEIPVGVRSGRPIRVMIFFFREGIMQLFEAPVVPATSPNDDVAAVEYQSLNSGGPWVQTGVNEYAASIIGLDYDALGNPTATDVFQRTIRHDRVTDTLTITSEFFERDAGGAETIRATNTITATRVKISP
jgi:hypothetical protein